MLWDRLCYNIFLYTITYINDYKVLYVDYVDEARAASGVTVGNESAEKLVIKWAEDNIGVKDKDFVFNNNWMNAGSTPISKIDAGNDKDITLYPHFNKPYTARFVDQKGNILSWCLFQAIQYYHDKQFHLWHFPIYQI